LKNLFTESLSGRKYIFELYPLDFEEFLLFKGSNIKLPKKSSEITEPIFEILTNLYDEYLHFGGFPEVTLKKRVAEKKKSLEDIFISYFQLEVLRLKDFRKNKVIRDLILLLLQRTGSKLDINKLSSELGVSRITLAEYVSFLQETYFISLLSPFSRNRDSEIRKAPKIYGCDCGLMNYYARINEGQLFENNVFQNLKLKGEVNYYQKKTGAEIDFILDKKIGLEVKISPTKSDARKLEKMAKALGLKEFKIISKNYSPDLAASGNLLYGFQI
jgi:hypothetical protein